MPGPTVVLVHGAFADASGFAGVIRELESAGHMALAPPNPLRSVAFDASVVSDVARPSTARSCSSGIPTEAP